MKGPILSTLSQFYSVHRSLGERSPCKHGALSQFHMPFGERSPRGHSFTVSQFHSVRGPFGERSHCEHTFSFTVYKDRLEKRSPRGHSFTVSAGRFTAELAEPSSRIFVYLPSLLSLFQKM